MTHSGRAAPAGQIPVPQRVMPADPALLAERARELRLASRRVVIGIVGAPGSGKSTLSAAVAAQLAQRVLDEAGLAEIKGAPETFDAAGYVTLLRRLMAAADRGSTEVVYAPEFRRAIEEPIAGAVAVGSEVEVIITEGNYLLLDRPPWNEVAQWLTESWYLDVPDTVRIDRLVSRHIAFGRTPQVAMRRSTSGSDGRNAAYVLATRARADVLLRAI